MNTTFALDCDFVAKIFPFHGINQVEIYRAGNKPEKASFFNRRLCPGDVIKVPKSISQIHIKYQSNKRQTVEAGSSYEVVALAKPCQTWCKVKTTFRNWFGLFTETESDENYSVAGGRGVDKSSPIIKMQLAASEGSDYEFFLSADNTAIPLFWYGGKAPYKLTVKDASDKVIVDKQLEKREFSLTLPDTKIGSKYKLTIQSANSSDCNEKNSWICQKPLVITALPNVIDSMENLVPLLADCDKNWRLEIWRQLSMMPDSEAKHNLMEDLAENDFELCE